jgi:hypothetical protein
MLYSREPDFRAKIRYYTVEEGGRKSLPFQGIRSDLRYTFESKPYTHMIWPEFLDENEKPYPKGMFMQNYELLADFYIVDIESRDIFHFDKINVGVTFFIIEGREIGEGVITKVFFK